ncbi:hypothetical protein GCM10027416_17580 [Okibacterium endophyticum]
MESPGIESLSILQSDPAHLESSSDVGTASCQKTSAEVPPAATPLTPASVVPAQRAPLADTGASGATAVLGTGVMVLLLGAGLVLAARRTGRTRTVNARTD